MICGICYENRSDCHVNPCYHTFCFNCIKKIKNYKCPFCRREMVGIMEYPDFSFNFNIEN